MPSSSDPPPNQQPQAVDIDPYFQEEASRRRSPGRKSQGKSRRKNESNGENVEKERSPKVLPQELTSPPSILSQLHASTSPVPAPSNGYSSPLLEAWNAASPIHRSDTTTQPLNEWPGNVPIGRSPPQRHSNGASIAGSPPQFYQPLDELRGGFTHASPPASPQAAYRQVVHKNSEYQSFGENLGSSPNSRRPASVQAQHSYYPPPPHQPQAHFYGAPELDFGLSSPDMGGRTPGDGHCCVFDSLPLAGNDSTRNTQNVLLVGFEYGLNVYHVDKQRCDRIGRLEGLRGSVVGAKILPPQLRGNLLAFYPLVAVIVHGPFVPSGPTSRPGTSHAEDEEFDPSGSMMLALHTVDATYYQTTVEVYSLRKGEHLATLFRSPKVEARFTRYDAQSIVPPPVGDLRIQAKGRFIIVSSGISGEVFIFENTYSRGKNLASSYSCIGKIWTRTSSKTSRSMSVSSNESEAVAFQDTSATSTRRPDAALLSLSHRWLAIVPPSSSAQTTLHGKTESEGLGLKIPGISSHASPAEPQVTCELDTPESESLLNRVTRDLTQEVMKASQWVGGQGMQLWNNYWYKPSGQNRQGLAGSPPNQPSAAPPSAQHNFPPTHAQDNMAHNVKNQQTLVSIIDLEKLSQNQHLKADVVLRPLATFALPYGCSLLSFAPSGLNLLTASAKGDVQHVWDLMRMIHGEAGKPGDHDTSPKGPSVREVARFTRMTVARIIDVVWTEPRGNRLAIVTERGTVHIYELPSSAFQWPPPRRILRSGTTPSNPSKPDPKVADIARPESAGSTLGSTLGMFTGKTQPFLAAVRGRRPSTGSSFPVFGGLAMTAGAGAKSGKAVAAGINRSVSAAATGTVNTIRHLGENRLALPGPANSPIAPGCVRWLRGKDEGLIAVFGGGIVRIHSIRQSSNPNAGRRRPSVIGSRPAEYNLPKESTSHQRPQGNQHPNARPSAEFSKAPGSFWSPHSAGSASRRPNSDTHPLSYAEIETNAPYQPFHTDRRVNFYVYENESTSQDPHHLHDTTPWAFGEPMAATRISVGSATHEDDAESDQPHPGQMENVVSMEGNEEEGQQIVVTTRRKRNKKDDGADMDDEGEIFEDECEVVDFAEERV